MNLHFIVHESFESPGVILDWAKNHGHSTTFTKLYQGDILPESTELFDYLIVMGG